PNNTSALQRVEKLHREAISLSDEIRLIAHDLHPPRLEKVGLESALRSLCKEFGALTRLRIEVRFEAGDLLPADVALCCYLVVQEALRNMHKHGHAQMVHIRVYLLAARLVLLIADDGHGIELERLKKESGLGLRSMEERVQFLSGEFRINKRKTGGT